eukprot:CAMPEP_0114279380 /NCGR_PEP_ID=MMETSP0059-20121206/1851_1 /TAXON_ID=36894 /ORGANISM="Pyramimonas parkeae, Strain CCMP726" /LENGTH=157 /DNA_ID=CAMNT_0001399665 /DNA_START=468 /DNA_END=941 /DNA_ORIENTATION=+
MNRLKPPNVRRPPSARFSAFGSTLTGISHPVFKLRKRSRLTRGNGVAGTNCAAVTFGTARRGFLLGEAAETVVGESGAKGTQRLDLPFGVASTRSATVTGVPLPSLPGTIEPTHICTRTSGSAGVLIVPAPGVSRPKVLISIPAEPGAEWRQNTPAH